MFNLNTAHHLQERRKHKGEDYYSCCDFLLKLKKEKKMKKNIITILLLSVGMMAMGCGGTIIPCNTSDDCSIDIIGDLGGVVGMICNDQITAYDKCMSMDIPIDLPFPIPGMDCSKYENIDEIGVCEVDISIPH